MMFRLTCGFPQGGNQGGIPLFNKWAVGHRIRQGVHMRWRVGALFNKWEQCQAGCAHEVAGGRTFQ